MDIVKKIKPLKASYDKLNFKHKLTIILILLGLANFTIPHETAAVVVKPQNPSLIFVTGNYTTYLDELSQKLRLDYRTKMVKESQLKKQALINRVQKYLRSYNSPLADTVPTLITLKNWKQIVALANAESSLCRKYPKTTANCWGVGGADLWDMGNNLNEGVVAMNHFLENYPRRSDVKYFQMTFDQMNGFYKQPAADHWVVNNETVYYDLVEIEKNI